MNDTCVRLADNILQLFYFILDVENSFCSELQTENEMTACFQVSAGDAL